MKYSPQFKNILYKFFNTLIILFTLISLYNCKPSDNVMSPNNNGNGGSVETYYTESSDYGNAWDPIDSNGNYTMKIVYAGALVQTDKYIACGIDTLDRAAIWRSTDNGDTWIEIFNITTSDPFVKMQYCPSNNSAIAVTSGGEVYRSADRGLTWSIIGFSGHIYDIDYFESSGKWIAVGDFGKAMYSVDAGLSWLAGDVSVAVNFEEVCCIPNSASVIAMASTSIYKSTNGGLNYVIVNNPSNAKNIAISAGGFGLIVTTSVSPSYYSTTDYGDTWVSGTSGTNTFNDIKMINDSLCIGTRDNGIFYTIDMGQTWNPTSITKKMYELNRPDYFSEHIFVFGK